GSRNPISCILGEPGARGLATTGPGLRRRTLDKQSSVIRVGIVGAGRGMQLANALRTLDGVRIVALCDTDPVRAEGAAAMLETRPFTDFSEFLATELDAVVIASPIPAHAAQVEAALAADIHVLCEVLPCATVAEARDLVRAVRASRATYTLAENFCFLGEVELVRRLDPEGRVRAGYYTQSDHLLDIRGLWRTSAGYLARPAPPGPGVYSTPHP